MTEVKSTDDLLEELDQVLKLKSAINTGIPYTGWIELESTMEGWNNGKLKVPVLIP